MIIDATKINYFKRPERSSYDYKTKVDSKERKQKDEVGVIIDASTNRKIKLNLKG